MKITLKKVCIELSKGVYKCRLVPYNMSNNHLYWRIQMKWTDAWHEAVRAEVIESRDKKKKFDKANVTVLFYKHQLFDTDGAYNAAKPVIDGLRHAGVIIDDSTKYIKLSVEQIKVDHRKDEKVEIIVTDQ